MIKDEKLESLKAEVIAILEKKDKQDFKKAIEYFEQDEKRYSHLEKSLDGKWIEKAGYGVGTVRIWKGKKYKKVSSSPVRWVRVFDKNDRGAATSMGKYIAQVKACKTAEDLYNFCLKQRSLFQDDNGVDLPIMDKLRAAIDEQKGKVGDELDGSKHFQYKDKENKESPKAEEGNILSKMKEYADKNNISINTAYQINAKDILTDEEKKFAEKCFNEANSMQEFSELIDKEYGYGKTKEESFKERIGMPRLMVANIFESYILNAYNLDEKLKAFSEKKESESKDVSKMSRDEIISEMAKQVKLKTNRDEKYYEALRTELDKYNKAAEQLKNETGEKIDIDNFPLGKIGKKIDGEYPRFNIEQQKKLANRIIEQYGKTDKTRQLLGKLMDFNSQKNQYLPFNPHGDSWDYIESKIELEESESEKHQNRSDAMKGNKNAYKGGSKDEPKDYSHMTQSELEKINHESFEKTKQGDDEAYEIHKQVRRQMDINDAKLPYKRLMSSLNSIEEKDKYLDEKISEVDAGIKKTQTSIKKTNDIRKRNAKVDLLHEYELNREALIQLKNDLYEERDSQKDTEKEKKSVEEIEREERHAKAELNNKVKTLVDENTKYNKKDVQSMLDRVHMTRYSPSAFDFDMQQASLDKDIEVMTDALKRQIQGEEVGQTQKRLLEIIKEDKAKKEAIDIARKEFENGKWKEVYRGAYEYQEETQDDKPLKNQKVSSNPYEPTENTDPDKLKPISTNESIGEGKVKMPYSKELSNTIKQLMNTVEQDKYSNRGFLTKVYYADGNLIATDGRRLKVVKVGELNGIESGCYVDIDNSKEGIKITKDEKFSEENKFPQYKRVIPESLNQKITLDNKALKNKIKTLKDEGGWSNKDPIISFDIQDGALMLDGEKVGDAKGVEFEGDEETSKFFNMNAEFVLNALSGDTSNLMCSFNPDKAMTIGTNSTVNVIMPMSRTGQKWDGNKYIDTVTKKDFKSKKASKSAERDQKNKLKIARQDSLNEYVGELQKQWNDEKINKLINSVNDTNMKDHAGVIKHSYEALKEAEKMINNPTSSFDGSKTSNRYGYNLYAICQMNPKFKTDLENMAKQYGIEIRKSLFDYIDFELDDFEDESYSDYDASQPDLFNSPAYKVSAALDSIFGC